MRTFKVKIIETMELEVSIDKEAIDEENLKMIDKYLFSCDNVEDVVERISREQMLSGMGEYLFNGTEIKELDKTSDYEILEIKGEII